VKAHLKKLSGQTLLYGMGAGGTRIIALLLLPVYAHILTPAEYGELAIAYLAGTLMSLLLESGQRTAYFRLYYQDESSEFRRRLTGTVLLYLLVATVVLLPLFRLALRSLAEPVLHEPRLLPILDIVIATVFFETGSVVPFAVFRAEQRAASYAKLAIGRAVLNGSLNLIAVVVLGAGVRGILLANLITSIAFCAVCLVMTTRTIEWRIDPRLLRRLLSFGLPHVPANAAGWVLGLSDRLFLQYFGDLSQVGVYAIGCSVAGGVRMIMGWFNTAWAPYAMSLNKAADAPRVYARLLTYGMTLFCFLAVGASLFAREAVEVLTADAYIGAARVVPLVVAAYLLYELYYLLSLGFDLTLRPWFPVVAILTAGAANLVLNTLLIPRYGMMGAAAATALSYAVMPLLVYPVVQRLYPVPYEIGRLFVLAGVSAAVVSVGVYVETQSLWVDLPVAVGLLASWGGILLLVRFFSPSELAAARSIVRDAFSSVRART